MSLLFLLADFTHAHGAGTQLPTGGVGGQADSGGAAPGRERVPLVGSVRGITDIARDGQEIILDADQAEVHVNPAGDIVEAYSNRARLRARRLKRYARLRTQPAAAQLPRRPDPLLALDGLKSRRWQ